MSTERPCQVCSSATTNPKFCSRACAASHNNRTSPKRRPEGACGECGGAILRRKHYCDVCAPVVAERERKDKEAAAVRRREEMEGRRNERIVFTVPADIARSLPDEPTCGDLLDVLIALVHTKPSYITQEDQCRYLVLLNELKAYGFIATDWSTESEREVWVEELSLTMLDHALRWWIESSYDESHHPLMLIYTIDVGVFILAHAYGMYERTDDSPSVSWQLAPLLPATWPHGFPYDPMFKASITQRIAGLHVVVKVPPGGRCVWSESSEVEFEAGDAFLARILRCHLSWAGGAPMNLEAVDDSEPRISLSRQFRIPCEILVPVEHDDPLRSSHLKRRMKVPGRWITHAVADMERGETLQVTPVPEWCSGT